MSRMARQKSYEKKVYYGILEEIIGIKRELVFWRSVLN
jgi:hypothetical protein